MQPSDGAYNGTLVPYIGNQIVADFLVKEDCNSLLQLGSEYVLAYGGS
jgi:hypothetical protein